MSESTPAYSPIGPLTGTGTACHYCGAPAAVYDHVMPKHLGGTSDPVNLVPACWSCNGAKGGHVLPPNWKALVPEAVDVGTSWHLLAGCDLSRLRMLLAAAARALVVLERGRRAVEDVGIGEIDLPNTRHMRP